MSVQNVKNENMKKLLCLIFGHKWDKSDQYCQPCKRCSAYRNRMYSEYKSIIGEKSVTWQIINK